MDELKIPVLSKEVVIEYSDGIQSAGLVFIPTAAPGRTGPMRLVEWLNGPDAFFPFKVHGVSSTLLINKRNILCLTAYHDRDSDDYDAIDAALRLNVRVEVPRGGITGQMIVDMPESKQNALGALNSEDPFVYLFDSGKEIHVNKRFIIRAVDTQESA